MKKIKIEEGVTRFEEKNKERDAILETKFVSESYR